MHPAAMAIRRRIRDILWTIRGIALRNPPLPSKVESILFVCLGNICRSPFAAVVAAERLRGAGRTQVRCASAGIAAREGARAPAAACDAVAVLGLSLVDHRPQALTRTLVDAHDLIVVMEAAHLWKLRAAYPDAAGRVVLLSLFDERASGGYERYNIEDPFMRPPEAFGACYGRIDRGLSRLLGRLHDREGHTSS